LVTVTEPTARSVVSSVSNPGEPAASPRQSNKAMVAGAILSTVNSAYSISRGRRVSMGAGQRTTSFSRNGVPRGEDSSTK